jgi:hypothetical protein
MPSWLFHNNGDGTFTDVSKQTGIAQYPGKAWGVVACDVNNDGNADLFVANDTVANFLLLNDGKGKFEDIGSEAGVAFSAEGSPRSGMGVDAADYDSDGWADLFVTNVDRETLLMSGWGLKFFDYDNDGDVDLFVVNGHPDDKVETRDSSVRYSEPMLLFRNMGNRKHAFENVSAQAGSIFLNPLAARGMAIGDFDNDGAVDVLVTVNNDAPLLLQNVSGRQNHWIGVKLVGKKANRDAVGARVTWQSGDLKRQRTKVGGGSYLSSHDPRMVLGIGRRTSIDSIEVKWPKPSALVERFANLKLDSYATLQEGTGTPVA